jgi:hypothetical protein
VIATADGDLVAELGPIYYLNNRLLSFEQNANIRVRGQTQRSGDGNVFVVTEVMTHPGRWVRIRYDDLTPAWREPSLVPGQTRYLWGIVDSYGGGYATVLTDDEGPRTVWIAPTNYFESRHWRLRLGHTIGIEGYDDDVTRQFIAIRVDHENETWRVRRDDGTPIWR